jgi:hypothetical protein
VGGPVLTMLCSDIVGSTGMYDRLGDGVLAVFTSPRSALAAAVELQHSTGPGDGGDESSVAIRVGLSTGEVVEGADVYGAAVAASARINAAAEGGQVLAADVVVRLAGTIPGITVRHLGPVRLKGFHEPIALCEIQSEETLATPPNRARDRTATDTDAFVGRATERREINDAIARSTAGRGQLVLIGGEAGIGKTRLAREVLNDAAAGGCRTVWAACWEGDDAPSYWPWIQIVRALASVVEPEHIDRRALGVLAPELSDDPTLEVVVLGGLLPPRALFGAV